MSALEEARARAIATYDAASDHYDDSANTFWSRCGRRTIERLALVEGASVLDVCCGSGASAMPAAERVGPTGSVLGIDLSERLLALARAKAIERGLRHVEFRVGDLLDLEAYDSRFDAVVCVFGIFFVPDMVAAARSLWSAVRPGGTLAVTTWGPRFLEPASSVFWDSIRRVRPDLYRGFNPWDLVCDPAALGALLDQAGIADADVVAEAGRHAIDSPDAWWSAVMGSGYRGTVDRLSPSDRERVRDENLREVVARKIDLVETNVVFATAVK